MSALPEAAARKLGLLQQAAADASALAGAARETATLADARVGEAARALRVGQQQQDEPAELAALESELAKFRVMFDATSSEALARGDLAHAAQHVSAMVGAWVAEQQRLGRSLEAVTVEAPRPRRGEDAGALVRRLQADIHDARRELDSLALLPLPREELRARARDHVRELGQRAAPKVDPLTGGVALSFRTSHADVLALLCAVVPGAMTQALDRQIADVPDTGMSAEDKAQRGRELKARLVALEYSEEAAICGALASGHVVARRADMNPACVLGLRSVKAAKAVHQAAA